MAYGPDIVLMQCISVSSYFSSWIYLSVIF